MVVAHLSGKDANLYKPRIVDGEPVVLGSGAYGKVDEVTKGAKKGAKISSEDRQSLQPWKYARKEIHCPGAASELENECQIMEKLSDLPSHRRCHFVTFHEAYSRLVQGTTRYYLITSPVADGGNLIAYLNSYHSDSRLRRLVKEDAWKSRLQAMMGCLVAGLASMHIEKVRHHDIHPWNILVHDRKPLYTDFGLSHDFQNLPDSKTKSDNPHYHYLYRAPEFEKLEQRGTKSDVFALGGVLFEIAAVLTDDLTMKTIRPSQSNQPLSDPGVLKKARDALLLVSHESPYQKELELIHGMLDKNLDTRYTALDLILKFRMGCYDCLTFSVDIAMRNAMAKLDICDS